MDDYIGIIIIAAVIMVSIFVTRFLFGRLKNNASKTNCKLQNIIRQPKLYLWVGVGYTIFCFGMGMFFLLAPEKMIANYEKGIRPLVFLFFLVLCIPGIYIILLQLLWKVEIGASSFTFRNSLGIKREYQFENVEIRYKNSCTRFYQNKKYILGISFLQENFSALDLAIEVYKNNNKQTLKKAEPKHSGTK